MVCLRSLNKPEVIVDFKIMRTFVAIKTSFLNKKTRHCEESVGRPDHSRVDQAGCGNLLEVVKTKTIYAIF